MSSQTDKSSSSRASSSRASSSKASSSKASSSKASSSKASSSKASSSKGTIVTSKTKSIGTIKRKSVNPIDRLIMKKKQCLENNKVYDEKTKKCIDTPETCKAKGKVYNNKTKRCNKSKPVIEKEQCPICTEVLTRKGVIVTKCKHKFHMDCLEVWCRKNSNRTTCPMCRQPINDTCLEIQEKNKAKNKAKNKGKKIKVFQRDIDLYKEDPSHLPDDKEWVLQDDVTNLSYLFQRIPYEQPNDFFKTIGVSEWNVSNVTNMYGMFLGTNAFNQPLEKWDVSNVESRRFMFEETEAFKQSKPRF